MAAIGAVHVIGSDDRTLVFVVPTCDGDPTITVAESPTEVHIRIFSATSSGHKCADNVETQLRDALAARTVVDDTTGREITIQHG